MSDESNYSKRELDSLIKDIGASLTRIETQTTEHNHRMTKMERNMLVVATIVATLLLVNGSELIQVFKLMI